MAIAFTDVHYGKGGGRAACILADGWEAEWPLSIHIQDVATVEAYEPGNFFRRELPCLLAVLRLMPSLPEIVVVDGYVRLPGDRPGLGARLYDALERRARVVGIAKKTFVGISDSALAVPVFRGISKRPLFITAAGMDPAIAAEHVRRMAGKYRIPEMVRIADRLSRS